MNTITPPIALTFRLGKPDDLPSVDDAVAMHHAIADNHGVVALGKTGKPLAAPTIERALASAKPTVLVITRTKVDFHAYRAPLKDILEYPHRPQEDQVPRYYRHLMSDIRSWLMIGGLELLTEQELATYRLCSNQRPLLDILRSTRTANMLVHQDKH